MQSQQIMSSLITVFADLMVSSPKTIGVEWEQVFPNAESQYDGHLM